MSSVEMRGLICLVVVTCAAPARAEPFVAWIEAHGASQNALDQYEYNNDACDEIAVGPRHEAALQCYSTEDVAREIPGEDVPAYRVVEHYLIRTVRGHDVITLIDVPVRSQALDAIPRPPTDRTPWDPFVVSRDGMAITVGDPADANACRIAWAKPAEHDPDRIWRELDRDLHERICKARGRYAWRRDRFVHR